MPAIRDQGAVDRSRQPARESTEGAGLSECRAVRPAGCGRHRRDHGAGAGRSTGALRPAAQSHDSAGGVVLEDAAEMARQHGHRGRNHRHGAALSALRRQARAPGAPGEGGGMSSAPRLLPGNRVLRYTLHERVIHWVSALAFIYVLLTGLAFYSPRLYWLATILGGGPTARVWHPWVWRRFSAADPRRACGIRGRAFCLWRCARGCIACGAPTCASPPLIASGRRPCRATSATKTRRCPRSGALTPGRNTSSG